MRLAIPLACLVGLAGGFAQSNANLDAIRYPPLAAAAKVQGDVLISGGNVVTGPPLLREAALRSIDLLNFRALQTGVVVHFVLVGTVESTGTETIKKGDAFDRFFLRLFGIPTVKKIEIHQCVQNPNVLANRIDSAKDPIEVRVYGKVHCPTVNYAGTLDRS
jgi:hypothetical protein